MKLKTLIVDDEHAARKELRHYLEKCDALEIIGEATNAVEAQQLITALQYDLLFLDINLPGGSAFKLIEKLCDQQRKPWIVFVTAHENFAADAFGVDAVDYVLKPIDPLRLKKAIQKVINLASIGNITDTPPTEKQNFKVGLVPVDFKERTILIPEQDVIYFYAEDDYTFLKTTSTKYLTKFTLRELEQRLSSETFIRCHRSYLLNLKSVIEVSPQSNGTIVLTVNDNIKSKVPVSRAQAKRLREVLGI